MSNRKLHRTFKIIPGKCARSNENSQSLDKIFRLRIIFTLALFCFTTVPGCVGTRLLGSGRGRGLDAPQSPTGVPLSKVPNPHIGTWMATHPCLCPYGAGNGSSCPPMTPQWDEGVKKTSIFEGWG